MKLNRHYRFLFAVSLGSLAGEKPAAIKNISNNPRERFTWPGTEASSQKPSAI